MNLELLDCIVPSMPNNKLIDRVTAGQQARHVHELVRSPLELEKLLLLQKRLLLLLLKRLLQLLKRLQQRSLPRSVFHLQEVLLQQKHPHPLLPPLLPLPLLRLLLRLLLLSGDK